MPVSYAEGSPASTIHNRYAHCILGSPNIVSFSGLYNVEQMFQMASRVDERMLNALDVVNPDKNAC